MNKYRIKNILIQFEEILNKSRSRSEVKKFTVILFSSIILLITYFLSFPYQGNLIAYELGDIATEDIRVNEEVRYELPLETERRQKYAKEHVPVAFDRDYQTLQDVIKRISVEMENLLSIKPGLNLYDNAIRKYPYLKASRKIERDDVEEMLFATKNRKHIKRWAKNYATLIFDNYGILYKPLNNSEALMRNGARIRTLRGQSEEVAEFVWQVDQLIHYRDIYKKNINDKLHKLGENSFRSLITIRARKVIIYRLLQLYYKNPYLRYNELETGNRLELALRDVKPAYAWLKKGLTIVRAGDYIDSDKLFKINILNREQGSTNFQNILGLLIIQILIALAVSFYIYKFSEFSMENMSSYIILTTQIITIVILGFVLSRMGSVQNSGIYFALFIPMGYMATITCYLLGPHVTFATGIYLSLYLFFLSGNETSTFILSTLSVIVGIYGTMRMERRTQFVNSILLSAMVICAAIIGFDLSLDKLGSLTKWNLLAAMLNSMLGIILATGIVPLYENIFNLPTRFRLMELADFNHPLLKKMSEEASSSYTHSIMMATISERAVSAIKGDSLLARVGCLYHDIGKMLNAGLYAENKHLKEGTEKKSGLKPQEYAALIISHVTDGIAMAREYRLPEKIISFIPEHHGTSIMQYFYHQALKKVRTKSKSVDKEAFQYPGPKPQTKETAVVMMADSIEAASRSLSEPSKENLEILVDTIMNNKIEEDQLEESPLTLLDLKIIKESFLSSLLSTYHLRPKYPSKQQTLKLEQETSVSSDKKSKKLNSKSNAKQALKNLSTKNTAQAADKLQHSPRKIDSK